MPLNPGRLPRPAPQVVAIKATAVVFCTRPGVAPASFCEPPMAHIVDDLRQATNDLEEYHQVCVRGIAGS